MFDRERFHAGDDAFFTEIVNAYSPRLLPVLRQYAAADSDPYDLLQDVWLRAYEKRRAFDGRGSFFGWLLAICRTVGIAAVRKRGREPATVDAPEIIASTAPHDPLLRATLREAVLALPDRQREVVMLRLVEGMSTADTARVLGCAEGTVKASLYQATHKLREYLKETVR